MTITINLVPVNSSDPQHWPRCGTNTLVIRFKSRGEPAALYHYSKVSADDFTAFKDAESVGSHFYRHIKEDSCAAFFTFGATSPNFLFASANCADSYDRSARWSALNETSSAALLRSSCTVIGADTAIPAAVKYPASDFTAGT